MSPSAGWRQSRVLVDTGPLVAMRNTRDQYRSRVLELAKSLPPVLHTTWPVLTEAAYLLRQHPREVFGLVGALGGELSVASLGDADAHGIAHLMQRYSDQGFSLADSSLMWVAARDEFDAVFTIDRKDFNVWATGERRSITLIE